MGKRKFPERVRIVSYGLKNGYPMGGMGIEGQEERLPGGIYGCAHAAEYLIRQGWPDTTIVLYRNEGLPHDSFLPLTLKMAAATLEKKLKRGDNEAEAARKIATGGSEKKIATGGDGAPGEKKIATGGGARKIATGGPTVDRGGVIRGRGPAVTVHSAPRGPSNGDAPRRPKPGSKGDQAWQILDRLASASGGTIPDRKAAMDEGQRLGLNPGNVGAEFSVWRRWYLSQG